MSNKNDKNLIYFNINFNIKMMKLKITKIAKCLLNTKKCEI